MIGLLMVLTSVVGFLLSAVLTVAVGQKVLSYLNTRTKFLSYIGGALLLYMLLGFTITLLARQAQGAGVIKAPYQVYNIDLEEFVKPLTDVIQQAAHAEGVPYNLLRAICTVESRLRPDLINEDDGNGPSVGLCQIKPETARLMGFTGKFRDLLNPATNATYAARYFRWQLDRYFWNIEYAIAAYNSGSLNLNDKHQIRNIKYVRKVMVIADEF